MSLGFYNSLRNSSDRRGRTLWRDRHKRGLRLANEISHKGFCPRLGAERPLHRPLFTVQRAGLAQHACSKVLVSNSPAVNRFVGNGTPTP